MYEEIANNYKNIVKRIDEKRTLKSDLNRYEYYLMGGSPYKRAFPMISYLLRSHAITTYEYQILSDYFHRQMMLNVSHSKEFILKTYYQFGDTVITDEEKQSIWEGMHGLGLSDEEIDDVAFTGAVRAYAIEKGLLKIDPNAKKRVLKKKNR